MTTTDVALLVFGILVLVLVGITIAYYLRHHHLRQRFGPEYDRVADKAGPLSADRELRDRERRHAQLHLKELDPDTKAWYGEQWQRVQARFVESPETAIGGADELVTRLIGERGYPVRDYDEQVALLSVDHARVIDHYRLAHDIAQQHARGRADTETLRQALMHYRVLVGDILGTEAGLTADALPGGAHPGETNADMNAGSAHTPDTTLAGTAAAAAMSRDGEYDITRDTKRDTTRDTAAVPRDGMPRDGMPRDGMPRDGMPRDTAVTAPAARDTAAAQDRAATAAEARDEMPRDEMRQDEMTRDETSRDTARQDEMTRDEMASDGAVYGVPGTERERADRDPADDAAASIAAREADATEADATETDATETDATEADAGEPAVAEGSAPMSAADADVAQRAAAARGARVQGTAKVPQGKKTLPSDQRTPSDVDETARR